MIDLSPLKPQLGGKPVAILGLGASGLPVFEACKHAGIDTVLWDDNADKRAAAEKLGAVCRDFTNGDMSPFSLLCLSPGIPLTHPAPHPAVIRAKEAGIEVTGDIELFHRALPDARTIAVTGTNGKSTTTALIGHILQHARVPVAVGGNIGTAALSLDPLPENGYYVLELSSYQLDLLHGFEPTVSVLLNVTPDHLDRHGGMQGYAAVKERVFRGKGAGAVAIDDDYTAGIFARAKKAGTRKMTAVSCLRPLQYGVYVSSEGKMFDGAQGIVNLNTCPALKGRHNWQNAAVAYTACRAAGVAAAVIAEGLQTFPGLAHRQKIITAVNDVTYINDSKATNDEAAAVALGTYKPVYWIAGGRSKGSGYAACEKHLSHVRHAFLIGEAATEMAAWLGRHNVAYTMCQTLDKAVAAAHQLAQKEQRDHAVVLLSPACASWDQFASFEQRGDAFAAAVRDLTSGLRKGPAA